jgi:hypothetical protein
MLKELPANCPVCGRIAYWSPLRVCCTNCFFQTRRQYGEDTDAIIRRWNRAVLDGEGLYDLTIENRVREQARSSGFRGRNERDADEAEAFALA